MKVHFKLKIQVPIYLLDNLGTKCLNMLLKTELATETLLAVKYLFLPWTMTYQD